ncbi:MAG: PIN domain-containing protein [Granulosicoccaceae bacterium]
MQSILIDAGPLIALFSVDDKHHQRYDNLIRKLSPDGLRLLTTWPCIVEASYLLNAQNRFELLEWIRLGGVVVCPFSHDNLGSIVKSMKTYTESGKREMDFADATLYWLAVETGIIEIMTVDNRDFSRYRLPSGGFFIIH